MFKSTYDMLPGYHHHYMLTCAVSISSSALSFIPLLWSCSWFFSLTECRLYRATIFPSILYQIIILRPSIERTPFSCTHQVTHPRALEHARTGTYTPLFFFLPIFMNFDENLQFVHHSVAVIGDDGVGRRRGRERGEREHEWSSKSTKKINKSWYGIKEEC